MSQELNLTALSMSPQELDDLELQFQESEDWEGWINFTRELAEQQAEADQSRAIWRRLIKRFEQVSIDVEESNFILASDLAFLCGQGLSQELERSDLAMKAYLRAYNLDPESIDALQEARKIYEEKGQWELALQLCTLEQDLLDDPREEAALLLHMAEICSEKLSNADDAVRCVREAAKLIPDFVAPDQFAHLIDEVEGGRKEEYTKKLEEAEAARNPRQKARKMHEAAEVLIDLDPQDPKIEDLLTQSLEFDTRNEKAKQALQTFYQLNERWEALSAFLIERLANTQRRSDKLDILKQLAHISEHALGDEIKSAEWHRDVLTLNPVEESSVDFCVRYYNKAEQWSELVKVYESALRMRRRGDDEAEMLFQIAMVLWKKVVDYNEAEKYFKRIKLNNPRNPLMLNFYADYYRTQEDWRRLLNVLGTQQSESQSDEQKIEIATDMADVAEHKLKSRDKTIEIWRSVLKIDPRHPQAHDELSRLYHESGKWSALLELIKEELDLIDEADVAAQVECYERLIQIYRDKMRQAVMVTNTYHQILDIDPRNETALEALEKIYRKSSRWSDLADMLERRVTILEEKDDQEDNLRDCYRHLAELNRDRLNHSDQSIYYFEKMLGVSEDLDAITPLVKLYKLSKNWSALFGIYKRQVNHLEDESRRDLMIEMAQLADERLGAYHDAIELWQEIVNEDPDQTLAWESLAGLYHKDERWESLSSLYAEKVEHLGEDDEALSWMKKRATLLSEQMENDEAAAEVWWQVLERSKTDLHAEDFLKHLYLDRQDWASIERLYECLQDWSRYVRLLKTQTSEAEDSTLRIELFQRLARCYSDHLQQDDGAIQAWESVLAEDPMHMMAAETLAPYYREREQWEPLDMVLEITYQQSEAPSAELLLDLAQLNEKYLSNYTQAYQYYAHGLRLYYQDAHWLEDSKRVSILSRDMTTENAQTISETNEDLSEGDVLFVTEQQDTDDALIDIQACEEERNLLDLLEELLQKPDLEGERKQEVLWTLAEMYHHSLLDLPQAIDYYELYRNEAGESATVLEPLIELYQHHEAWDELLGVYQAFLAIDDSTAHQERLLAFIGELYEQKLLDLEEAENTYLELLSLNEESLDALRGLQRIADHNDDQEALAEYLNAELNLAKDAHDLASLHSRIGLIALHRESEDVALESFKEALKYDELHEITVRALQEFLTGDLAVQAARLIEPFSRTHEEWELLCEVLRLLVDDSSDTAYRRQALLEIALIQEEQLSDPSEAFNTYQQLLVEDTLNVEVIESLERLADTLSVWEELTQHYQKLSYGGSLAQDTEATDTEATDTEATDTEATIHTAVAMMSRRLASRLEDKLNDEAASRDIYEIILEAEGEQIDLLQEVDRLNQSLADWENLVQTRERVLVLLTETDAKVESLFSIAQVYAEVIQNPDEAISTYQRIIDIDPRSQQANQDLEQLLTQTAQFDVLADHLRKQLEFLEGEEYQSVGFQLSEVLHQKLNDASQALDILAEVLSLGFHEASVQAIEKMLVAYHDGSEESRVIRLQGCDLLRPLYADDEHWQAAIHLLEVRLEDEEDLEKRCQYSIEIAQKLEQQGQDPRAAFECYGKAFAEHFANEHMVNELQRLADVLDAWSDCVSYIDHGIVERLEDSIEQRISMLRLLAHLHETHLEDLSQAIHYQLLIVEDEPMDRLALTELSRLYKSTEKFEELSYILEKQVESYQEDSEEEQRTEFAFALADLCQNELEQSQRAIEVYQQIRLEIAPLDTRAYEALEQLYMNLAQYNDLVEIYLDEASQIEDLNGKKDRLYKAALVYEESLDSPDDAVNVYQRIVEEDEGDEKALSALARLYQKLSRFEDQLAVFAQQKELCEATDKQDEYELQRALIFKNQLMDPISALESLQSIVGRQSHLPAIRTALEELLETPEVRLEVAETLVPIYEQAEDWEPFVLVLHDTLEERIDVDEQVKVLRRLAEIEEKELGRQEDAFRSLAQAYRRTPSLLDVESELERLADLVSLQADLVQLFNEVVVEVPEREIEIRSKVAHLAEHNLQDYQTAIDSYQDILLQEPEHLTSLLALENLYSITEDYQSLADTLNQMLEIVTEEQERSSLFERMASLYELKLEQVQESIDIWRKQLQEVNQHAKALQELERLLVNTEAFDELAAHYEEWIEVVADEEEKVDVKTRLAVIYETQLREGQTAVDLYKEVLTLRPNYEPVQDALAELFLDENRCMEIGAERRSIAEILEPIYREADVPEQLALVLDVKQEAEQDPQIRGHILLELADIQENILQDQTVAFQVRLQAMRAVPEVQENRLILQRLAHKVSGYEELSQVLTEAAAEVLELDLKSSLLLELGKVLEAYLEDYDRAGECYQEILLEQPGHEEAIKALEALFTRLGQYQDLVDLYIRLADESDEDQQRIRRYFQACETLRNLDNTDQLIETYHKILELDESNAEAFKELELLFKMTERWMDLADLLQQQVELKEDAKEKASLRHRLAGIYETHLNQVDESIEIWQEILNDVSDFIPAYEALERLASQWRSLGAEEPRLQTIAEILESLYFENEQWEPWLQTQDDLVIFEFDPQEKSARLQKVAQIYEHKLLQAPLALNALARAFKADFANHDLQLEIDRLARETAEWSLLIHIYTDGIEEHNDPDETLQLWLKVAQAYEVHLQDIESAVNCYYQAHHVDEMNIRPLDELERILEQYQKYADLVVVLQNKAQLSEDLDEKKKYLFRTGGIFQSSLSNADEAIEVYRQICQEDSEDLDAINLLETLFTQEERWQDLVMLLQDKLSILEEGTEQMNTLHQIAQVYQQELNQVEDACTHWRQILEVDALNEKALQCLKESFKARSLWNDLLALLEEERANYQDADQQSIEIDLEIAHLQYEALGDELQALETYHDILKRSVEEKAEKALEQFLNHHDSMIRSEACRALQTYYQHHQRWQDLVRVNDIHLSLLDDSFERLAVFKTQANIKKDHLDDAQGAFYAYANALREDLEDEEALDQLQQIGGSLSLFAEMAEVYKEIAEIDPHSEVAIKLFRIRAKLCTHRLNDPNAAMEAWSKVRTVDPEDSEALKASSKLFEEHQKWSELIDVLQIRADLETENYALRIRLGELLEQVNHDLAGAVDQWKQVLLDYPEAQEAQEALEKRFHLRDYLESMAQLLEPIYREKEAWTKLITLNEALLNQQVIHDVIRQEELWLESAELLHNELQNSQKAFEYYCQAFRLNPLNTSTREYVFTLGEDLQAWSDMQTLLLSTLNEVNDPEILCQDYIRLAQWSETHQGDLSNAVQYYQQALQTDSQSIKALDELERIYQQENEYTSLQEVLQMRLQFTYDDEPRAKLLQRLAELSWSKLQLADVATQYYEELIMLDDRNQSAYQALEQILSAMQKDQALINLLERKADALNLSDEQQADVYCQLAEIAVQMEDFMRAADAYRQVLDLQPGYARALERLQSIYAHTQNWDELRDIKEIAFQQAEGDTRFQLALELADLCQQHLMMPDDALDYFQEVLKQYPDHQQSFSNVYSILREQMRWGELIDVIEAYLQSAQHIDATQAIQLRIEIAQMADEEGDAEKAIEYLNQVLALDAHHAQALTVLARLYERDENWEKASETLKQAIEFAQAGSMKAEAWQRLGMIYWQQLERTADAKSAFLQSVQEESNRMATDALLQIAREEDDQDSIKHWLQAKIQVSDGQEKARTMIELARMYQADGLTDKQQQLLESAYQLDENNPKVVEALVDIYMAQQRWADAEPLVSRMIQLLESKRKMKSLARYVYRAGQLAAVRGDISAAQDYYQRCRKLDATYAPNLLAMTQLLTQSQQWDDALEILKVLLLQRQVSTEEKVQIFYLNGVTRKALGDTNKAKSMFQRALGLDPDHTESQNELNQL